MTDTIRVNLKGIPYKELEAYPWETMLDQEYHWMDKYGNAHWIQDMDTDYLENALRFARRACRYLSSAWWDFAWHLNGEMATYHAEHMAMMYDEYRVPLVEALERELVRRQ